MGIAPPASAGLYHNRLARRGLLHLDSKPRL